MARKRLYLDNAATSFPKPGGVVGAMTEYMTRVGASPGRGAYRESREGARVLARCRERVRDLIGGSSPDHVVFTLNTTDALNLAIKGVVRQRRIERPGEPVHLVTTAMDHNSVLRPFNALRDEAGVEWTCVDVDPETGIVDPADIARAIRPETALVALVHASNVSGTIQPVAAVGGLCRDAGVPLLVDAAQSLGHLPVDVDEMSIDLLAFPGHKGLLGPLGTGGLYLRPGIERLVATTREGGTGSASESDAQPETMPDRYEAGSHNTVGIAGLDAALAWLADFGVERVRAHELEIIRLVLDRLEDRDAFPGLRLLGPRDPEHRTAVFSFTHDALGAHEIAAVLETEFGILARAGLHCAPHAHASFGTTRNRGDGAVRLSFGVFNTIDDAEYACDALSEICRTVSAEVSVTRTEPQTL